MLENSLDQFVGNIFSFLIGKNKIKKGLLVKKHLENLHTHGDFSYPNTLKSWVSYLDNQKHCDNVNATTLMEHVKKASSQLIDESSNWTLQINKIREESGRILLFLHRKTAIQVGLLENFKLNEVILGNMCQNVTTVVIDPLSEDKSCITLLRLMYLCDAIRNLLSISMEHVKMSLNIFITSKSSTKCAGRNIIMCGAVLNSKTGMKETTVSADDFIRSRQKEMSLIAQHKYGVRVKSDSKWREFIENLGESATVFELLQIKPNSAVKINFDTVAGGSSKGASFVLYNCARLETIIRTFNQKVEEGAYPELPDFQSTDFGLLTHEDEWAFIFNYVLGFPLMLNNCVEVTESVCEFRPHQICSFLCSMVRVFSQYYRRVRILTEPRTHLLPIMFARIHMLRALNLTLKTCLKILNIKSVSQMYLIFYYFIT